VASERLTERLPVCPKADARGLLGTTRGVPLAADASHRTTGRCTAQGAIGYALLCGKIA
jgi:hypothetical protein